MSLSFEKRTFTVDEYHRMAAAGILSVEDRVELIEGEIIKMSPIGSAHAACVNRLNAILTRKVGTSAIVSIQNSIRLNNRSEPQPDVVLLRPRADFYSSATPTANDVILVIEVSDTTAKYDRRIKVPLYARALIPEVWLALLADDRVEIYTDPADGKYREVSVARRTQSLSVPGSAEWTVTVDEIFG